MRIHDGGRTCSRNRKPEKPLDAISKIKKEKEGQYEEKIIQVCVEEFHLNKEEVLTSLKKAVDDRMLKIVNKNNKNPYSIVQEKHLDDDCVIDSQIHETLESTDVVKDLPIRLDKTSHDDLTKLANEFRLFKAEMQQQITSLRGHFLEIQKDTHLPKSAPNLDFSALSHGSEHTIQNRMVNKNYDNDNNSVFVINLLKDTIFLLERQLIEKNSIIGFLVKHQMSPIATYSNINCDNKILNNESTEVVKNKTLPNDNIGKGDRKKVIILGDSLLNDINENGLSKRLKVVNKPGTTSERLLLQNLDNLIKYQPESVIIHVGTNDLTNGTNMLNNAKKIVKELTTKLPKVKIAFSELITRKDKKNLDKNVTETNKRLKNYCRQKDIGYIDNSNITEDSLGIKKLHLNRKGNSFFAKNLLKYLNNV